MYLLIGIDYKKEFFLSSVTHHLSLIILFIYLIFILIHGLYFISGLFIFMPRTSQCKIFQDDLYVFLMCPHALFFFLGALWLSSETRCSRFILYFLFPKPGNSYFFRGLWFLLVEKPFKNQALSRSCLHYS